MDAHRDTNEGLKAGGPPTVQLGQQRCFCLGLPPPQTSLSGRDSISKLQNLGSIQRPHPDLSELLCEGRHTCTRMHAPQQTLMHSFTVTQEHMQTHTYTQTQLINPQITPPIITTLVLIRNYLKHFPIRVYVLSRAGVCLANPTGLTAGR